MTPSKTVVERLATMEADIHWIKNRLTDIDARFIEERELRMAAEKRLNNNGNGGNGGQPVTHTDHHHTTVAEAADQSAISKLSSSVVVQIGALIFIINGLIEIIKVLVKSMVGG